MPHGDMLREQLAVDLRRLHALILRCTAGDLSVTRERDRLGGEVHLKLMHLRSQPVAGPR